MLDDNQHGYYLYNDIVGADIAETICSLFKHDIKEFEYRGWIVYRVEFWN
jgi:hypothetical protein